MVKYLICTVALLIAGTAADAAAQTFLFIPYGEGDEPAGAELEIAPGSPDPGIEVRRGEFVEGDLTARITVWWNEAGLHFAIRWHDDRWDEQRVPRNLRQWRHPSGRQVDRMYLFDDLAIQLALNDEYFYGVWLAPRTDEPYQWDTLRRGPDETEGEEVEAARFDGRQVSRDELALEGVIPWDAIQFDAAPQSSFQLRLVVPDSDCPDKRLEEKLPQCVAFLAWVGQATLGGP